MTSSSPRIDSLTTLDAPLSALATLRIWAPHLTALVLPLAALAFLLTASHGWPVALALVAVPGIALQLLDRFGGRQLHAWGLARGGSACGRWTPGTHTRVSRTTR
jgi:hypothetical protein